MNKKILLSMGLPVIITSPKGGLATIELNKTEYVVCRHHPNNSVYLYDAKLEGYLPKNMLRRWIYKCKLWINRVA